MSRSKFASATRSAAAIVPIAAIVLCISATAHAQTGPTDSPAVSEPVLFSRVPVAPALGLRDTIARQHLPLVRSDNGGAVVNGQARIGQPRRAARGRGHSFATMVTAGFAGAIAGFYAGAVIGGGLAGALGERHSEAGLAGVYYGAPIGAVGGAVLGTWLASR
jgi:hypothetical protein